MATNPTIVTDSNIEIAQQNFHRYQIARDRGHDVYQRSAKRCEDYFLGGGRQWEPTLRALLEAEGRPVIEINEILPRINTVIGHQINNRMMIKFQPKRNISDQDTADKLTKLFMHIMSQNQFHWLETQVFSDGLIMKRGYFDIRAAFDDSFTGEVSITMLDPLSVIPDPFSNSYDPDQWQEVTVTEWMAYNDVVKKYGMKKAKLLTGADIPWEFEDGVERNRFGNNEEHETVTQVDERGDRSVTTFIYRDDFESDMINQTNQRVRVIDRQYYEQNKVKIFVNLETGDFRKVPDTWDDNRIKQVTDQLGWIITEKVMRQIRWTVTAGDVVLHNEWSPYDHYTIVPFFAYFRRGKTIGMVDNLIGPQDQLNKMVSQVQHVINTTANSGWMVEEDSLVDMDTDDLANDGAKSGIVIEYRRGSQPPEKIQPNQIPTAMEKIIQRTQLDFDTISGVQKTFQGGQGREITGIARKVAINQSSIQLGGPLDNLAYTRRLVAIRVLDIIQKFYNEHQLFLITKVGEDGKEKLEPVEVNIPQPDGSILNDLTIGEYTIEVDSTPNYSTFESSQFNQMMDMRQVGIIIPDDEVIKRSNLSNRNEIAERVRLQLGGATEESSEQLKAVNQLELQTMIAKIKETLARAEKLESEASRAAAGAAATSVETAMDVSLAPKLLAAAERILDQNN